MKQELHIGYEIRETNNLIHRYVENERKNSYLSELSFIQGGMIHHIYKNRDRDIYQKDLEERFEIRRSTATGILQGLEKKGYIERVSDPDDKRMKKLVLTDKAVAMEKGFHRQIEECERVFMDGLSEEEKRITVTALKKIRENIRKKEEEYD